MFTEFDVLVSVIILISGVASTLNGALKDMFTILGYIGAAAVTLYFFPHATTWTEEVFRESTVINIAAVIVIFIVALILISIVNAMILDNLRSLRHGVLDRSFGLFFGLFKGWCIACILHAAVMMLHSEDNEPEWLQEGRTYEITKPGADYIHGILKKFLDEEGEELDSSKNEDIADENRDNIEKAVEDVQEAVEDGADTATDTIEGVIYEYKEE